MKRLFKTAPNKYFYNIMILVVRVTIALFMLTHGLGKLNLWMSGEPIVFPDPLGVGDTFSLALAIFAEVICSVLLLIGLGTRLVVIPLIITMIIAVFVIHSADGFEKQELGGHYLLAYLLLLVTGGGKYSIDHFISRKMNPRHHYNL
ncbi:DoxX family protein [Flavobacterium sp. '19STA2R22 D10 B1']|uniref:DoxX family protein n=1 Tax=Flavobacterium aerium TaxID=3037261 RepID=UPI00278BCE83|nr:DoxX family protein [Flavobacterium sp. '19STA2R22 D10 B1']